MEINKTSKKINNLAKEKESLLNELGIKMRKKVYRLHGKLAFVVDHPSISLKIRNADYIGEADLDEANWQKLKQDAKENKIEMKIENNRIKSFTIVPKNDEEVETQGIS